MQIQNPNIRIPSRYYQLLLLHIWQNNYSKSLLILLLTSLSVAGLIHKKYFAVGFLIGIAALIKLWPVIFIIPILVYPRYYKVLVSLSLTIISIVVITIGLFGFTVFSDYFFKVIPYEKIFSNYPNNNSFTSSITKVFRGVDPHRYPPLWF